MSNIQLELRANRRSRPRVFIALFALVALLAGLLAGGGHIGSADAASTATITGNLTVNGQAPERVESMGVYAYPASGGQFIFGHVYSDGHYVIGEAPYGYLDPGSYKLEFVDYQYEFAFQWWTGASSFESATAFAVADGATVTGKNFALVPGATISGTLSNSSGAPLRGTALAYTTGGEKPANVVGAGYTNPDDGSYSIPGLAAGSYKVGFSTASTPYSYETGLLAPSDPYLSQWYSAKYSYGASASVVVTTGQTKSGINAALENPTFADVVDPTYQFYPAIQWLAQTGISQGTAQPEGKPLFKPLDAVSRQAMASFLFKMAGADFAPPETPTFADVDSSNQFYTAIEWMASRGITTGTLQPSGKPLYKPTEPVSRQAMALFLARFSGVDLSAAPTGQSFADVSVDSPPAAAIAWMKERGISTGTTQPSGLPLFKPLDPVSRQAMAAFIFRLQ